jgi:hypothetical protein
MEEDDRCRDTCLEGGGGELEDPKKTAEALGSTTSGIQTDLVLFSKG